MNFLLPLHFFLFLVDFHRFLFFDDYVANEMDKVNLVIVDVPNNLPILLASNFVVPKWNKKVANSIEAMMLFFK